MPNRRTPLRLNLSALLQTLSRYSLPLQEPPRNQLITLNQTEHIFQAYFIQPHIFTCPITTNRVQMEIGQEWDVLTTQREFQYRVHMFPIAPASVRIPNQTKSIDIREGATMRTSASQEMPNYPIP